MTDASIFIIHCIGDYGLIWVGNNHDDVDDNNDLTYDDDNDDDDDDVNNSTTPIGGNSTNNKDKKQQKVCRHKISYDDFKYHIDQLNNIIYSDPIQVHITDNNHHKIARLIPSCELVEKIKIIFYLNGIMIKNGPFRYCDTTGYKLFMKDVIDGYFPSEFQGIYIYVYMKMLMMMRLSMIIMIMMIVTMIMIMMIIMMHLSIMLLMMMIMIMMMMMMMMMMITIVGDYPNGVIFDLVDKQKTEYLEGL